jgi:predicted HNH restriction endonuclease
MTEEATKTLYQIQYERNPELLAVVAAALAEAGTDRG